MMVPFPYTRSFIPLFFWVAMLASMTGFAQDLERKQAPLKLGLSMSGFSYVGDLTENDAMFHRVYPGGNLSIQFDTHTLLGFQFNAGFGSFTEQNDNFKPDAPAGIVPNTYVNTSLFYSDLRLKFTLLRRKRLRPFFSAGAGFLAFNPRDAEGNFLGENFLSRLEHETYNTTIPQIPVAAGFDYRLNPVISVGAEYTYRYTPSDYLDNIGELGPRKGNDVLHSIQFSVYFSLGPEREDVPKLSFGRSLWEPPIQIVALKHKDPQLQKSMIHPETGPFIQIQSPASIWDSLELVNFRLFQYTAGDDSIGENGILNPNILNDGQEVSAPAYQLVETNWLALEEKAMREKRYIYYRVKQGDDLTRIALRFKVRPSNIRSLNFMVNNEVYPETYLRLPNIGIPID